MHSRSLLLIEKELFHIQETKQHGLEVVQSYENFKYQWTVKMRGPPTTLWEDGRFKVIVLFDEAFNYKPPVIVFITIPFHPNVDPVTGRLSIGITDNPEEWDTDMRVTDVLQSARATLANPQLDFVINPEAEDLFLHKRDIYNQLVKECVMVSQRIDEPLQTRTDPSAERMVNSPMVLEYNESFVERMAVEERKKDHHHMAHIKFEDYFSTWSGIATSKPKADFKNPHLRAIEGQATLLSIHHGVKFEEIEDHLTRQLEQHKAFVYGNFSKQDKRSPALTDEKLARMEQMRKIYLAQKTPTNLSRREISRISLNEKPDNLPIPLEANSALSLKDDVGYRSASVELKTVKPSVEEIPDHKEAREVTGITETEKTEIPADAEVDELADWAESLNPDQPVPDK